jgi:hypothetical protein
VTLFLQPKVEVFHPRRERKPGTKVAMLSFALSGVLTGRRQALAQFMPDVMANWDFID